MKPQVDPSTPLRPGEELDVPRLLEFLRERLPGLDGPAVLEQFPGGHSNLTYLLRYGDRELVIRRPPHGNTVQSAHDMGREFDVLSRLCEVYPPAPRPIVSCDDPAVIGAPFYVMERIRGVVFRVEKPQGLAFSPESVRGCCLALIEGLAELHGLDYRRVGLAHLYKGPGYVARQVRGWAKRWEAAKTKDLDAMRVAGAWLEKHLPDDSGACLIHNDYKFDNLIFDANDITRLVGVLDWEMATVGDPLADLATTLSGFIRTDAGPKSTVSQSFMVREPGAPTVRELAEAYAAKTGRDLANIDYYHVLGKYKGAVLIQQIYARYHRGLTTDTRFANFGEVVRALADSAVRAIEEPLIGA